MSEGVRDCKKFGNHCPSEYKQGRIKTMGFRGCSPGPRHQGASGCPMSSESTAPCITLEKLSENKNNVRKCAVKESTCSL